MKNLVNDDLGYLPKRGEETKVPFTLMIERQERASMRDTSFLVFSESERGVR